MNRLLIIIKTSLLVTLAALLLSAARPLICFVYRLTNNGLELRQVKCYSNEFSTKPHEPEPTPSPTETPWPTETPELPMPYDTQTPTPTWSPPYPLPTMPTVEPYPMMWIEQP